MNRPTTPGKSRLRCSRNWLATATRWATRSLRARQVARNCDGSRGQRSQPGAVGAQGVGQHERVESVVLVAGRAVAAAQVFQLVRADDHHGDPGVEQGVNHRPIGAFDGHFLDAVTDQGVAQLPQPGGASLLAANPSGEAPLSWCRGAAAGSLAVRRSTALSPVDGRHAPGNRRASQNSCWTSTRQASRAMTQRPPRVHRRPIRDHRHPGWCTSELTLKITDTRMVHP